MVSRICGEMTSRKKEKCRNQILILLGGKGIGSIPANEFWCFPLPFGLLSIHVCICISRILTKILFLQALTISLN